MKAKTLIKFQDLKEGKLREVGEEFECSQERFDEIIAAHDAPLVEKVEEAAKKTSARRGRKTAKKEDEAAE